MFLENSRYSKQKTVNAKARDGRSVSAVALRIIPPQGGVDHTVSQNDRLDILAHRSYKDPTAFWHIADANSELEARELTKETGRKITLPDK